MAGKGDKFRPTKLKEYRSRYDEIIWNSNDDDYCCNCDVLLNQQSLRQNPELYIFNEDGTIQHVKCEI